MKIISRTDEESGRRFKEIIVSPVEFNKAKDCEKNGFLVGCAKAACNLSQLCNIENGDKISIK